MQDTHPLPSGRDWPANAAEWKNFIQELRRQWSLLWRERIDDKLRAEGISNRDFELLFLDKGTIVFATRDYKLPVFREIVEQYDLPYDAKTRSVQPSPTVGGWRKFARDHITRRRRAEKWRRTNGKKDSVKGQQLKKGGRGWLHFRR